MNKFIKALSLVAVVVLVSSQSFAAITIKELSCTAPRTSQGNMIVGVGYAVQIKGGFNTHILNPNGTIGAAIEPSFQLVTRVIAPSAQPRFTDLNLVRRDADGNYILATNGVSVVVNYGLSVAQLTLLTSEARAVCQ